MNGGLNAVAIAICLPADCELHLALLSYAGIPVHHGGSHCSALAEWHEGV